MSLNLDAIAKSAGLSRATLCKARFLIQHADEETKVQLRLGHTTIHREYQRIRSVMGLLREPKTRCCPHCGGMLN